MMCHCPHRNCNEITRKGQIRESVSGQNALIMESEDFKHSSTSNILSTSVTLIYLYLVIWAMVLFYTIDCT